MFCSRIFKMQTMKNHKTKVVLKCTLYMAKIDEIFPLILYIIN